MKSPKKTFDIKCAFIKGQFYNVDVFDRQRAIEDGPEYLSKAHAYIIETDMFKGILPYKGVIRRGELWTPYAEPGIYVKQTKNEESWKIKIAYPRNKKNREDYMLSNIRDCFAALIGGQYNANQFVDINVVEQAKSEAFMPPIRIGDDPLNTIVKTAIRTKEAPFEYHGKRLEGLAVDHSKSIEGINIRNNAKRGILQNSAMSAGKAILYADTWELEMAIIVRDSPNSKYPMFVDGEMLIIYPNSEPFEIKQEKLIDIAPMVRDAISENNSNNIVEDEEDD